MAHHLTISILGQESKWNAILLEVGAGYGGILGKQKAERYFKIIFFMQAPEWQNDSLNLTVQIERKRQKSIDDTIKLTIRTCVALE